MNNETLMRRISALAENRQASSGDVGEDGKDNAAPLRNTPSNREAHSRDNGILGAGRQPQEEPGLHVPAETQDKSSPIGNSVRDNYRKDHEYFTAPPIDTPVQEDSADAYSADLDPQGDPSLLMDFSQEAVQRRKVSYKEALTAKDDRPKGVVVACDGNRAIVQGDTNCIDTLTGRPWTVGRMLSIVVGKNRVVGIICDVRMIEEKSDEPHAEALNFVVELQGEVSDLDGGEPEFVKGISNYPGAGAIAHQIRASDLAAVYAASGSRNGFIGRLSQDESIPAFVNVPDMLSKHFSVLGSTGAGKSATVSLLLHAAQQLAPDLRSVILDPHNEYTKAFPEANTINLARLDLPFWMLQLEEYVEVLFRGKPVVHEEVDALREFIPAAKKIFYDGESGSHRRYSTPSSSLTADTPTPYRMADLLAQISEEMGLLEPRFDKSDLKSLKARILAHCNDARYAFMFRHKTIEDIAEQVINRFFCLGDDPARTTIIQMAGMPSEVVNAVASVLCRLAFELAMAARGGLKILMICEEAHRYVPVNKDGFEPTRRAIARIAKEGRKYGSFMAIVSQRPSELDPTILSQCSTVFAMRLTNDYDQEIIRRAISSSSASTIAFISSLSNREAIAFGEGMSTPMRMRFRTLPDAWLPGAEGDVFCEQPGAAPDVNTHEIFTQWRRGAL